jgi:hypothetical protein
MNTAKGVLGMLLDNILTREQQEAGLKVSDDENVQDIVCLEYKGYILATWFDLEVKPAEIQREAQIYLSQLPKYHHPTTTGI